MNIEKTAKKSTKAVVNQRVTEIYTLLMEGFTRSDILKYASKWGVSDTQVDLYTRQATAILKEHNAFTLQDNMALITSNLWQAFRQAKVEKNLSEQHKILMSLAKLKGLDQMTVNHVIEDKRDLTEMSDSDLDNLLDVQHLDS